MCPIYTHDGENIKFSTSCDETDYSAVALHLPEHVIS
jgi:hypothetical protein